MNILQLLTKARDAVSNYKLNDFVVNIEVSTSIANFSKKPEITLSLATFKDEETLVKFGQNRFEKFHVERFIAENRVPYVFYRAHLDSDSYCLRISMFSSTKVDPVLFHPPVNTTFSALSRAM